MWCSFCGSRAHTLPNCPKTWGGQANRTAMWCSYCGARDHNLPACPKTWGGSAARAWRPDTVQDDFILDRVREGRR